jgi:hypothetical protein
MSGITPGYQELIDWCNVPAPQFSADTHAIHFYLQSTQGDFNGLNWSGFLFYLPGPYASSPLRNSHLFGTGKLTCAVASCASLNALKAVPQWVRVSLAIAINLSAVVAGIRYFEADNARALPGRFINQSEADVDITYAPSTIGLWGVGSMSLDKTSVVL